MGYKTQALSRKQLRALALLFRKKVGLENAIYFPIMQVLETLHLICEGACFEVVHREELGDPDAHAETDILNKCIRIREDVYDGAWAGSGRDRMTIAHEIAHFVLIIMCGVKLYRTFDGEQLKAYNDPEWQAKCFAGELMIPKHLVAGMDAETIETKCGVSYEAAAFQLKKF